MIFYFSGTGNSLDISQQIARLCDDSIISIADEMIKKREVYEYSLDKNEAIGFIYPVYAWAPPRMVTNFIDRLCIANPKDHYTYSIATCGENIGNTMDVLNRALMKRNFRLDSGFSIVMPNNYILMWDVDTEEKTAARLKKARDQVDLISKVIRDRESNVFQVRKGPMPFIFTGIINPFFNKFAMETKSFYAEDTCTGCRLCEEICPKKNIIVNGKPAWGSVCTQCLACIHRCPERAIQYGEKTKTRGRYVNPCLLK